jgi:hypothetical protein
MAADWAITPEQQESLISSLLSDAMDPTKRPREKYAAARLVLGAARLEQTIRRVDNAVSRHEARLDVIERRLREGRDGK